MTTGLGIAPALDDGMPEINILDHDLRRWLEHASREEIRLLLVAARDELIKREVPGWKALGEAIMRIEHYILFLNRKPWASKVVGDQHTDPPNT